MSAARSPLITLEKSRYGAASARHHGVNQSADAKTDALAERCLR